MRRRCPDGPGGHQVTGGRGERRRGGDHREPVAPIISILRLPMRSPRLPIITSSVASTNEYTSTIHSCIGADGVKSWAMLGKREGKDGVVDGDQQHRQ